MNGPQGRPSARSRGHKQLNTFWSWAAPAAPWLQLWETRPQEGPAWTRTLRRVATTSGVPKCAVYRNLCRSNDRKLRGFGEIRWGLGILYLNEKSSTMRFKPRLWGRTVSAKGWPHADRRGGTPECGRTVYTGESHPCPQLEDLPTHATGPVPRARIYKSVLVPALCAQPSLCLHFPTGLPGRPQLGPDTSPLRA